MFAGEHRWSPAGSVTDWRADRTQPEHVHRSRLRRHGHGGSAPRVSEAFALLKPARKNETNGQYLSPGGFLESPKSGGGVNAAGFAPVAELREVYSAVSRLAVVNPALGFAKGIAQGSLRQTRLLAEGAEQCGHGPVTTRLLSLCRQSDT